MCDLKIPLLLLEETDGVGGRVQTHSYEALLLDRGFQMFNYPKLGSTHNSGLRMPTATQNTESQIFPWLLKTPKIKKFPLLPKTPKIENFPCDSKHRKLKFPTPTQNTEFRKCGVET